MILYQDTNIISDLETLLKTNKERLKDKSVVKDDRIERNVTLYTNAIKVAAERLKRQPDLSLSELCLKVLPFADELLEKCTIDIGPDPKIFDIYYATQKITLLRDFSYIYMATTGGIVVNEHGEQVSETRSNSHDCIFDYLELFPETVGDVKSQDPVAYFKGRIPQDYDLNHSEWKGKYVQGLTKDLPDEPDNEEQKNFLEDL